MMWLLICHDRPKTLFSSLFTTHVSSLHSPIPLPAAADCTLSRFPTRRCRFACIFSIPQLFQKLSRPSPKLRPWLTQTHAPWIPVKCHSEHFHPLDPSIYRSTNAFTQTLPFSPFPSRPFRRPFFSSLLNPIFYISIFFVPKDPALFPRFVKGPVLSRGCHIHCLPLSTLLIIPDQLVQPQ